MSPYASSNPTPRSLPSSTSEGVTVDRFGRPPDGSDVVELPSSVMAMLELDDWRPDSIFVVGSAEDLDLIKTTLEAVTDAPVFSAAEADLALARGAALASARAVNGLETTETHKPSRVRALTALLAAAAVTLVVSLSVALGLSLSPSVPEQPHAANPEPRPRCRHHRARNPSGQGREPHRVAEGGPPRGGADHRGRRSARAGIHAAGRPRQSCRPPTSPPARTDVRATAGVCAARGTAAGRLLAIRILRTSVPDTITAHPVASEHRSGHGSHPRLMPSSGPALVRPRE